MSDNILLNGVSVAAGDTSRAKDRSTSKTQIVALDLNPGGSEALMGGSMPTAGDVASGASDSGKPVKIGTRAVAVGTAPTAVTAGQRADAISNLDGVPFVQPGHPNVVTVRATYSTAQTDTALVSVSSGHKIVVTRVSATLSNATTVDVAVRIGFGTANTPTTTGVVFSHPGMFAGQHANEGTGAGILGIGADDEDLRLTCGAATSGAIDCVVSYYTLSA